MKIEERLKRLCQMRLDRRRVKVTYWRPFKIINDHYDLTLLTFLWSPIVMGRALHFAAVVTVFLLSFFPRLFSAVADWMSIIRPHMMWP